MYKIGNKKMAILLSGFVAGILIGRAVYKGKDEQATTDEPKLRLRFEFSISKPRTIESKYNAWLAEE